MLKLLPVWLVRSVAEMVRTSCAAPVWSEKTKLPWERRVPAWAEKLTGLDGTGFPWASLTSASSWMVPPSCPMVEGVACKVTKASAWPIITSTSVDITDPEKAVTFAVPISPVPVSVDRALPSGFVVATAGLRVPRVVVNCTWAPLSGVPLGRIRVAVAVAEPRGEEMVVGFTRRESVEPVGATGLALPQLDTASKVRSAAREARIRASAARGGLRKDRAFVGRPVMVPQIRPRGAARPGGRPRAP